MENKTKLPKILVYGETFNTYTGGGVTLTNLFTGWGKENLAVICEGPFSKHLDPAVCDNYYQLGDNEISWHFPFNLIRKKWYSGKVKVEYSDNPNSIKSKRAIRKIVVDDYFFPILKYLGIYNKLINVKLSEQAKKWINDFNPDIIYIQTGNYQHTLLSLEVSKTFTQPKVLHVMDDWISEVKTKGLFRKYWHKTTENELKKLFAACDLLLGISELMAKEYKSRYNREFITFHNPIDLAFWGSETKNDHSIENVVNILYAGRIGYGIDSSLEEFAKGIKSFNNKTETKIYLNLQTPRDPDWTSNYDFVIHKKQISYESLPKAFSSYDFLLMPIDFSQRGRDFLRLSMPTKASEYMISGTPIIIFSPDSTAIVNYAKLTNWAYCITSNSAKSIEKSLKELISNLELRKEIAKNAINTAKKNHEADQVRKNFRNLICSTLQKNITSNE